MNLKRIALFGSALLLLNAAAYAGQATASLSVTANIAANCILSTAPVAFGTYDPVNANAGSGSDLAGTGTVTATCTNGSDGTITLGQGAHPAAGSTDNVPLRQMQSGAEVMGYYLYSDSGRTTVWGNTAGTGVVHHGTGAATDVSVYGRVPKGQVLAAGSYTDTVIVTINF